MEKKRYYSSYKDYTTHKRPKIFYRIMRQIFKLFIPKFKINYQQEINGTNIYVANHSKQYGPLFAALRFDKSARIWCDAPLVFYKEAPSYIVKNFFNGNKWSWPIALILGPLIVNLFRSAEVIPVYRDARLIVTYRKTIETMKENKNVILFAECPTKLNKYINELNKGFVEVGRMVHRYLKIDVNFIPMYIAYSIKQTSVGEPVKFDPNNNYRDEVERISSKITEDITNLASALPEHKIINFN